MNRNISLRQQVYLALEFTQNPVYRVPEVSFFRVKRRERGTPSTLKVRDTFQFTLVSPRTSWSCVFNSEFGELLWLSQSSQCSEQNTQDCILRSELWRIVVAALQPYPCYYCSSRSFRNRWKSLHLYDTLPERSAGDTMRATGTECKGRDFVTTITNLWVLAR